MKLRCAIIFFVVGLALLFPEPPARAGEFPIAPSLAAAVEKSSAVITNETAAARKVPAVENVTNLEPGKKRKASFLAAFGMVIISLLALATAIALLRSIRPH